MIIITRFVIIIIVISSSSSIIIIIIIIRWSKINELNNLIVENLSMAKWLWLI